MADTNRREPKAAEMLELVRSMFHTSFEALMENDADILDGVLRGEEKNKELYDRLTALAVEASRDDLSAERKRKALNLIDIISAARKIGDCCVDLAEQIENKIRDGVLFTEEAVREYQDLQEKTEQLLADAIKAVKAGDRKASAKVLKERPALDALADRYRADHIDRSIKGLCGEWARVRYLQMLDIVKMIALQCAEIAAKSPGK